VDFLTTESRRRNIKSIIFLGDFYHDKKELSVKAIDSARIICEMLNDFSTYIICGNHDAYFKHTNELNSLQTIDKYDNIKIVNEPTVIYDKIGLCP
jgi:metallophosphoesterase superfamily enzyme